jgi:DNA-binding Xre family transcriptional regulator
MARTRKPTSTVGRWLQKPAFKRAVAKEFQEVMLSELVLAIMAQDSKSVRKLADELGLSKTVIQNLRSGEQNDMKLSNFVKLTHAYGYHIVLEKDGQRIRLSRRGATAQTG